MRRLSQVQTTNHYNLTKATDYGYQDYSRSIRSAVHGLWSGSLDYFGFVDTMVLAVHRGLTKAWYEGAKSVGVSPDELTNEEKRALSDEINTNIGSILGFADQVSTHTRTTGNLIGPLYKRAEMWANRYDATRSLAIMYAGKDKKLKWELGECRENCSSCTMLRGRVYRASTWKKYDVYPKKRTLECRGYRCCCHFVETNDPCTPGRPPTV